ncbi:MAG: alpha/beta fold hydrolase [Albimonas sp.]|uniref:alpha/beta fold hydrolase n=1 Tax=Albimonas sp. TaxID=1872425 RepID=UPI0040577D70|tara:strand:- start:26 stop:994 length:969 start_codon:yes stop_codon:yes gene_type:complete
MGFGEWIIVALLVVAGLIGLHAARLKRGQRLAEAAAPRIGKTTRVPGGAIHWVESGEGPPIVLIHGLGGQFRHWTYGVAEKLAPGYRVISLDRPGAGYSERDSDDHAALSTQARMIADFLEAEGIEKPLVVGHSLGGAVTLTLALEHPDKLSGFALVAPLTHPVSKPPEAFAGLGVRSPLMRRALAWTVAVPMARKYAEATLAMVFAPEPAPDDFVTRGGGVLGLRPRAFVSTSADFVHSTGIAELSPRWEAIAVPGGVLYGDRDALLDYEEQGAALVSRLPHLDWTVLEGRGHMLPITAPEETAAFIRRMAERAFAPTPAA